MSKKALVVLSGGQDSTTCLYWARKHFDKVKTITFDYGQRHRRELEAARTIAGLASVDNDIVEIGPLLQGRSPLTDPTQPLEQYADHASMEQVIGERVELTFVPMRNALFLTLAANRAICADIYNIVVGVCQADGTNYPDCTPVFVAKQQAAINEALGLAKWGQGDPLHIHAPLMNLSKPESIALALTLPGCYTALAYSHTAYDGTYPPTGKDHATVLRAHGFELAGVPDPLIVRAYLEWLIDVLPIASNYASFRLEFMDRPGVEDPDAGDKIRAQISALESRIQTDRGIM